MNKNIITTKTKKRPFKVNWTEEEDRILISLSNSDNKKSWKSISNLLNNKTPSQCFYRFHSLNTPVGKKNWTSEEDKIIKDFVQEHGKKWDQIASLLSLRSAKQIKERFINKLDESLNRSKFTEEEDHIIIWFFMRYGSKWSFIAKNFQGRTPDMVKSRFYSNLQKRILLGNYRNSYNNDFNRHIELTNDKILKQEQTISDVENLSFDKKLKFTPREISSHDLIDETQENTPKSYKITNTSSVPVSFKDLCHINQNETLTDLSFDEDSGKEESKCIIANSNNLNTDNIVKNNSVRSDFDHKSFNELINENEIMFKDLHNANLNFNDNFFYCEKINKELISFIENDDCENIFEVLEY